MGRFLDTLLWPWKPPPDRVGELESRVRELEIRLAHLKQKDVIIMSALEALKAAMAADKENDAKLVAYLEEMKTKLVDMQQKLTDALARPAGVDEAAVQAVADELAAHVADVATHLKPAEDPAAPVADAPADATVVPPDAPTV